MGQVASDGWGSFPAGAVRSERPRRGVAVQGLSFIGGTLAAVAAAALTVVLTLVFAATVAVVVMLGGALIALYSLTRPRRPQGVLIEARRVGHSWVAYGWDQRSR